MGVSRLMVVRPQIFDLEKILKTATHEAADIIENMSVFDVLKDALASFQYVAGTTARTGRQRRTTHNPRSAAGILAGFSKNNQIALVFGSERAGLSNADLKYCQATITIPTTDFSSINLAQSVMIVLYELHMARASKKTFQPRLATARELEAMYSHLEESFRAVGLINRQNPEYWLRLARSLLGRVALQSREVKLIRGLSRHIINALNRNGGDTKNRPL